MITAIHDKDAILLEGLLNGNNKLVDKIYQLHFYKIGFWIKQRGGTSDDAADVFQEVIMSLYRRLKKDDFTLTCKLGSYLEVMSRNIWLTKVRDNRLKISDEEINPERILIEKNIEEEMLEAEQRRLYQKHFNLLGDKCRKVLQLFFAKVQMAEIAKQLDTTESYIKKKKFVCKDQLIKLIQADVQFKELTNGA